MTTDLKHNETDQTDNSEEKPLVTDTDESGSGPETDDTSTVDDASDSGNNPNREAAKYRRQLRDVEAERDQLTEQLTAARQQILDNAALNWKNGAGSIYPEALDQAGLKPEQFFTETGHLDQEALDQHMSALKQKYGHMFQRPGLVVPNEGRSPSSTDFGNAWEEAFKPPQH